MSRSLKKGPFVDAKLLKKVLLRITRYVESEQVLARPRDLLKRGPGAMYCECGALRHDSRVAINRAADQTTSE